jgi:hypothetical protein
VQERGDAAGGGGGAAPIPQRVHDRIVLAFYLHSTLKYGTYTERLIPFSFLEIFGQDIRVGLGKFLHPLLLFVFLGEKVVQIPHVADEKKYSYTKMKKNRSQPVEKIQSVSLKETTA